jgi:hypothetical protein
LTIKISAPYRGDIIQIKYNTSYGGLQVKNEKFSLHKHRRTPEQFRTGQYPFDDAHSLHLSA